MIIETKDEKEIRDYIEKLNLAEEKSHKGQNGRVLVIGGSSLFHASSIWAAEVASYFADIVHYSSTKENNKIFLSLKRRFTNGIVIPMEELENYVKEDDAILIGPGMMRGMGDEAKYTRDLTKSLIEKFPDKKIVFDAGSLQMMEKEWLLHMSQTPVITPHQGEFEKLFGITIKDKKPNEKLEIVQELAERYKTVILLKAIDDFISDGKNNYIIKGGNQGLTKGGTGDVMAGLVLSLFAKNPPLISAVAASLVLKRAGDRLFNRYGYWYNIDVLIKEIPLTFKEIII